MCGAAGGHEEEDGAGGGLSGERWGDEEACSARPGECDAASGREMLRLRQAGQDQDPLTAGAGRHAGGPGPPPADRVQPGEEAEEVWPGETTEHQLKQALKYCKSMSVLV